MMFRIPILLCSVWSGGVVAFAPLSPSSRLALAGRSSYLTTETRMTAEIEASNDSETEETLDQKYDLALLFDCDGVILETEELHRLAYNAVFKEFGVSLVCGESRQPVEWSVGYYDILQNSIGGGKPKMRHYFSQAIRFESNEHGDPTLVVASPPSSGTDGTDSKKKTGRKTRSERESGSSSEDFVVSQAEIGTTLETLIDALQDRKTDLYKQTVENNATPRPGLLNLMDAALADPTIAVGVCSASTKEAAQKVLACTLGQDRVEQLDVCILGDDVSEKKPSPMIYNEARKRLGIEPASKCVVVEDSAVGLRAAKAAGMRCLITYTESTASEDFYGMGADAKVPDLENNGNPVTLDAIFDPLRSATEDDSEPELLIGLKDDLPPPEPEFELVETFADDEDLPFSIELEPVSMEEIESFEAVALEEVETEDEDKPVMELETEEDEAEPETEPPQATLEPSPEEVEAFAASETDVGADTLVRNVETAEDAIPVTLSPTPEEKDFFTAASSEVEEAIMTDNSDENEVKEEPSTVEPTPTEEATMPLTEPVPKTTRILKPKMTQDDMGNFSM